MPWAKLDEHYPLSRKVRRLSDAQFRLDVSGICWSSDNLTNGHIPAGDLELVSDVKNPGRHVTGLIDAGRWHLPGHDCKSEHCYPIDNGWLIHDYLFYNPSREEVIAKRDKRAAAGRAGGLKASRNRSKLRAIGGVDA